jgi:hypothetical protein
MTKTMNEPKEPFYNPGPWDYTEGNLIVDANGVAVAEIYAHDIKPWSEHNPFLENGALIAYAPETLEFFQRVMRAETIGEIIKVRRDPKAKEIVNRFTPHSQQIK